MINMVATIVTSAEKADINFKHLKDAKSFLTSAGATIGGVKWLRPEIAFEIYFSGINQLQAKAALGLLHEDYDIAVQPEEGRLKKLFLADMDSTMISMESLDSLADILGYGAEVRNITARSMQGELDFESSLRTRVGLLKGQPANALKLVLDQIEYTLGAKITVKTMVAHGAYTALVSGGFTFTSQVVSKYLGFHEHHANHLLIDNEKLTGLVSQPIFGPTAKLDNFNRLCAEKNISPNHVCAIGDGANDIPMLEAAGLGVAYYGKPIVRKKAMFEISRTDLTTLLYYQGIAFDAFQL